MKKWGCHQSSTAATFVLLLCVICIQLSLSLSSLPPKPTPCIRICRYNKEFFDGKVCIGCFRDTYEISSWSKLTDQEKVCALQDAIKRHDETFEGSISTEELMEQARAWSNWNGSGPCDTLLEPKQVRRESRAFSNVPTREMKDKELQDSQSFSELKLNNLPLSPCTRICRYKNEFLNGEVCIGCFRDTYEIKNWNSMSANDKIVALEDASLRWKNSQYAEEFERAISKNELLRQATLWGKYSNQLGNHDLIQTKCTNVCVKSKEESFHPNYEQFIQGESVILLSPIATREECSSISNAVQKIANQHCLSRFSRDLPDKGLVRILTIDAAARARRSKIPFAEALDTITDAKLKEIFRRACNLLETEHSSLVEKLFGCKSLAEMFENDELTFSSREPAINVYNQGGDFRCHEDGQKLTLLIPLTSSNEFKGGGTAFWHADSRGHRVEAPSLEVRPTCGTPILFVGHVKHAGLPVEEGTRIVFVASFSAKTSKDG
mmetsp:Transcript_8334/g.12834  ORF Transcript_8334/g.12834 Transcript_8334/m.12834 type:complete len:493 (+) Transcript_8334:175-1653(+)|eukprot:CAMPEP_0178925828 /NCGR_PEP_ID=MMETSP0786-20121207/18154_1 /TAXON_ID=186022 /ORGANISM="Thalassionema frauenfeldii, Strain CCMP 1798" /LENGTH=492 /DNA_ID=CAMNT_0020600803 /DNA_START=148 /DNA_END=1623 /DNA_ORIENTATION=+